MSSDRGEFIHLRQRHRPWWRQFLISYGIARRCGNGRWFSIRHAWHSANNERNRK